MKGSEILKINKLEEDVTCSDLENLKSEIEEKVLQEISVTINLEKTKCTNSKGPFGLEWMTFYIILAVVIFVVILIIFFHFPSPSPYRHPSSFPFFLPCTLPFPFLSCPSPTLSPMFCSPSGKRPRRSSSCQTAVARRERPNRWKDLRRRR